MFPWVGQGSSQVDIRGLQLATICAPIRAGELASTNFLVLNPGIRTNFGRGKIRNEIGGMETIPVSSPNGKHIVMNAEVVNQQHRLRGPEGPLLL